MYRLRPKVEINDKIEVIQGYKEIAEFLKEKMIADSNRVMAIETYPGVDVKRLIDSFVISDTNVVLVNTESLFISPEKIFTGIYEDLTSDAVFGRFSNKSFADFLDPLKLKEFHSFMNNDNEKVIVIGVCASLVVNFDVLVYADITRREIQLRYKKGLHNWLSYKETEFSEKLKRAYYFEWPAGRELKDNMLTQLHYYIDTTNIDSPNMISGPEMLSSLKAFTNRPFRLVPFFEPGIWGGQWMKKKFQVGKKEKNLGWCFDGVPEENSILMSFGDVEVEFPAENLILTYPTEVLGRKVYGRFGKDFPIRFDYLDTMEGQNLSLQVHPTLDYAYRHFGAKYTQDESYYILDCEEGAVVYLGVKDGVEKEELVKHFEEAQETGVFEEEKYIYKIPVKKHDHFLIPAGTIHSSGKNCVVLEISNTPNRFTFKLWDWGRVDLDGKPRPISIHHGRYVINTDHNESFVNKELYNNIQVLQKESGYLEERTGLHELEAIETRRLSFTKKIYQVTEDSVNMLNLVDGTHVQVLSLDDAFPPFDIFYGETFIIPEYVKEYYLVPGKENEEVKILKAYIR